MRGGVATSKWRLGALFVCWGVLATLAGAVHSARDGRVLISQKLYLKSIIPILLPNSLTLLFSTIAYLQLIRFIRSYWPKHLLPRAYYNICLLGPPQLSPNQPALYVLSPTTSHTQHAYDYSTLNFSLVDITFQSSAKIYYPIFSRVTLINEESWLFVYQKVSLSSI